jgi:hypothetical protein
VAVRRCKQCDASVAADEQFCPNCGAFMDPLSPETHGNIISVSSSGFETFQLSEPPEEPKRRPERGSHGPGNSIQCPSCGAANPSSNRHCEECGARLSQAPLPTAPRPAVQATAGVRAALAISGLLFGVVIVALAFNVLGGDENPTTTTVAATSTTAPAVEENGPIPVISESCSVEGISSFICANLTSGTEDSYQVNWEELQAEGGVITIRLTFDQPMVVQQILWRNLTDPVRFQQNFRPRGPGHHRLRCDLRRRPRVGGCSRRAGDPLCGRGRQLDRIRDHQRLGGDPHRRQRFPGDGNRRDHRHRPPPGGGHQHHGHHLDDCSIASAGIEDGAAIA